MSNSSTSVCNRLHSTVVFVLVVSLLVGCGTSGDETAIDPTVRASAVAGTATLLPSVKTIPLTKGQFIASEVGNKWKLRARGSERVGDVLLLDDAAVKVVSTDSEQMTLTVTEAEIEDVFSKLSFEQKFNQSSSVFIPDPKSSVPVTVGPFTKATALTAFVIDDTTSSSLKIPFNSPPWVANLELQFEGKVKFDYESRNKAATTGALDVTGTLGGDAGFVADAKVDLGDKFKKPLGTIRIPIPLGIADGIGRILNIRVASIVIPVTLGFKAQVEAGITLQLQGSVQGKFTSTYDTVKGLSAPGPTYQGTLTASGLPSASTPAAPVKASLQIGPYIHLAPQLVILNKVATLGVDATMGLYGKGTLQAMVVSPYYCITVDPVLQGDAFGFFRHVFLAEPLKTPEVKNELKVGPTWLYPVGTACDSVQFSAATYSASQTDSSTGILVLRNGDTSTSATVKYETSNGTAVAGRDYTATSGILTFNANDESKTFSVPIPSASQGGTVKLALSQPGTNIALGTPSTATLTIEQKESQCTDPFPAVTGALSVNGESKSYSHVGNVSESISTTISSASANGGKGSASLSTQFQNGPGDVVKASLNFAETIVVSSTTNAGQPGTATFVPSTSATGTATCTVNDDGSVLSNSSGGGQIELLGVQPMADWLIWRRESCPFATGDGNGGVPGVVNFIYGRPFTIEVRMTAMSFGSNHPNLTTASASGSVSLSYSTGSFQVNDGPSDARIEFCRTIP